MSNVVSRRQFFGASTAAAAAAASVPMTAKAYSQISGANERLRVGVIGCGGMAQGHMRNLGRMKDSDKVEIVAVCDLYEKRLQESAQMTGGKPYKNYKDLLAVKDVDYVLNATPEHWHARVTMDALEAGKHVYCEKPMTRTVEQAKQVLAKASASKYKLQVGVQGTSDESYIEAWKLIQSGAIGKPVLAQIDYSRNHKGDFWAYPMDEGVRPGENLDWKTWLGETPKRPWDPERFFRWRRYWDYSGGIASDLFVHRVTRFIKALNLTFPEMGVGTGGKFEFKESKAEIPDTFNVLLDYPDGLTVQLISTMANGRRVPHLIRGHKATIEFTQTGFTLTPEQDFESEVKAVTYQKKGAEDIRLHHRNLMAAIRTGEALHCDVKIGYYGVVASEMGVLSYRKRKYMRWDKQKERIVRA